MINMKQMDTTITAASAPPAALTFPHPNPPAEARLVEISSDIKWLRLPMPYALDHVNIYLLRMDDGWLIIDSGLDSIETRAIWEELFTGPLHGEKIVGIACTHFHIDHMGLAGYLTERWHAPLYTSYEEYFSMRGWPMDLNGVPWQYADFFRKSGLPDELLPHTLIMFRFSSHISPLPPAFNRLRHGARLPAGNSDWQIMTGGGHSPEHALIYSAGKGVLISGDQLLPSISSNVSLSAANPLDDPLSDWFAALDLLNELPHGTLVLPGHGLPFVGIKTRIAELRSHHERKLNYILDVCTREKLSVYELVGMIYPAPLQDFDLQLALGECLAHVRYLYIRKRLTGELDQQGVMRYRTS